MVEILLKHLVCLVSTVIILKLIVVLSTNFDIIIITLISSSLIGYRLS